ncbi:MAG: GntR family transcriptional regulator [Pararhodobacter sp.]
MTEIDFRIRRQPPLGVQVYDSLRGMMQARVFQPGDRMVEEDLARRLSVSRTPVREALFRLELNGLVEQQDGRFVVPTLTLRDIHDIFEIRRLLEPQAVAGIAAGLSDADLAAFQAAADRVAAAEGQDAAAAANIAFRGLWMERIANRRLHETLARFDDQVVLVRRSTLKSPAARQAAAKSVRALCAAFVARDPEAAQRAMTAFVDTALAWFERTISDDAAPDA